MSKRIFVDLGANKGKAIIKALKIYPNMDLYIAYEPIPRHHKRLKIVYCKPEYKIYPYAVDICKELDSKESDDFDKVYVKYFWIDKGIHSLGSSFYGDKKSGHLKMKTTNVVDFSHIFSHFTSEDHVILKIDIEGKEYDLLDYVIKSDKLSSIKKIYVECHWNKIQYITKERHDNLVKKLQDLGFKITGDSVEDQFCHGV
jgi:FkbM family methyltransferase